MLLWISLYLAKLPALEFWMLVTKGGNACRLQRETCQSAQHNARKIWGLFLYRFVSEATLTRQEAERGPGPLISPVIHFLRKSMGFSPLTALGDGFLFLLHLPSRSPACILHRAVWKCWCDVLWKKELFWLESLLKNLRYWGKKARSHPSRKELLSGLDAAHRW